MNPAPATLTHALIGVGVATVAVTVWARLHGQATIPCAAVLAGLVAVTTTAALRSARQPRP